MEQIRSGGYLISKIHQRGERIFARMLKGYNIHEINPAQGRILFALWQEDGIPIQQLSQKTALSKSTLTRMLDRLEKSGHILRHFSDDDRRKVLISLTEENRKIKKAYEEVSAEMTMLFYQGFSEDEITAFEKDLKRIYKNLAE